MQNKNQKPKFKHNKKRNTAFLYESLVKELTKNIIFENKEKQKIISYLVKEHFNKNNILNKELSLYKQIYETNEFPKEIAEKLINSLKLEHEKLDESEIYNEQSKLIAKINKHVGPHVFDNFIPNYKSLASISQIFNKNVEAKQKVLLEQELISSITSKPLVESKETKAVDNQTIKRFVERFNEAYNESLLNEQKQLLSFYINSLEDNLDFKLFINEELLRISNCLKDISEQDTTGNAKRIAESLTQIKFEEINDDLIKKILYAQQYVHEVKN
jgi:hypothetical protein